MDSVQTRTAILDEGAVQRKIKRMALEIAEQNAGEKELIIAGIIGNGEIVAKCIAKELINISAIQVHVVTIQLDKKQLSEVSIEPSLNIKDKLVLIVDDVANTGKTMFYALKPFLNSSPKRIQTLALVERSHKEFPVQTDYKGLSISTTLQENIIVETEGEKIISAWLH